MTQTRTHGNSAATDREVTMYPTSIAEAKAIAAEFFAMNPEWVVGMHTKLVLTGVTLDISIDRDLNVWEV